MQHISSVSLPLFFFLCNFAFFLVISWMAFGLWWSPTHRHHPVSRLSTSHPTKIKNVTPMVTCLILGTVSKTVNGHQKETFGSLLTDAMRLGRKTTLCIISIFLHFIWRNWKKWKWKEIPLKLFFLCTYLSFYFFSRVLWNNTSSSLMNSEE